MIAIFLILAIFDADFKRAKVPIIILTSLIICYNLIFWQFGFVSLAKDLIKSKKPTLKNQSLIGLFTPALWQKDRSESLN